MSEELRAAATAVLDACRARGLKIATAESCTGGLVAGALTDIAGSSDVLDRGFVTYSNEAKQQMLGVPAGTLKEHCAVSRQTAEAMARGALGRANADLVVAITGIAGPGGGTAQKPVGLVYVAVADAARTLVVNRQFLGDRQRIRVFTTQMALDLLRRRILGLA